jgi:anti-sigma regulatory factor (Ser/Thr protein kinase)
VYEDRGESNIESLGDQPVVIRLVADADAPARARHRAVALTRAVLGDVRRGDLELLVSEIVSNAVLYGIGDVMVVLCHEDGHVRVEVSDGSRALPRHQPSTGAHGGYGLRLLDRLAESWGVDISAGGKTVWFRV